MIFYVTLLRALAACFITNAHYEGIYPSDIIANGGLIGDIIFFAVSGFCLCGVKHPLSIRGFCSWYGKRLWRVYPSVILCTAVYALLGLYRIAARGFFWWFVYPTYYHFVASIVLLYIPFFFVMKTQCLKNHLGQVMAGIGVVWLVTYLFFYEKSYYHIDSVYEPMIHFLFFESMLLGAWFRLRDVKLRNRRKPGSIPLTVALFALYFVCKLLFSRRAALCRFQFVNQLVLFAFLFGIFSSFSGYDEKLERMPGALRRTVEFLSKITLEVYVVQYVLIDIVRALGIAFPLNWIMATLSILAAAYFLHLTVEGIRSGTEKLLQRDGI